VGATVRPPADSDSDVVILYLVLAFVIIAVVISWAAIIWPVTWWVNTTEQRIDAIDAAHEPLEREE